MAGSTDNQTEAMFRGASIIIRVHAVALAAAAFSFGPAFNSFATDLVANVSTNVVTPITMSENTALSFGDIAVTSGNDDSASGTITLDADSGNLSDPQAAPNGANIVALSGGSAGKFTIFAGAAKAIPMTITIPLTSTLGFGGQDDLDVSAITVGGLTEGVGAEGDCSAGCNMTSASNGNISFPVGATLSMAVGNGDYGDGTYSGTFTVTATYQ